MSQREGSKSKKQLEQWRLEQFRSRFAGFPIGTVIPSEEPDFLIQTPARTVGIELTELHRDVSPGAEPPQAQEALRWRLTKRAQAIHVENNRPHLHASVFFSAGQISKFLVEPLAQKVAGLIAEKIPAPDEPPMRIESDFANPERLPPEIDSISTYNLPGATRSFFTTPGSTWMAQLQPDDVRRALQSKESKYSAYRSRCDEAWLIVGCNGEFMSTWYEGVERAVDFKLPSSFDRGFIMSYFNQTIVEL